MNFKLLSGIEQIDREKWNAFVSGHPNGSVFQSPEMYDLYTKVETYSPVILAIEDDQESLRVILLAVIIKDYKGLAGRFTARTLIYGGPLIDTKVRHAELITHMILDELIKVVAKKSLYIQVRNLHDLSIFGPTFRNKSFIKHDHLNLIVSTRNKPETMAGISKTKIRQARQSERAGAELVLATSENEVLELYQLLENMYHTKIKKPLPPLSFFLNFFRASTEGKLGQILLAKFEGKVIGGIVCPITKGKSLNEWYICGMDKNFKNIHPSVMLTYGAIEYALNNGIPSFDFMGIGSPDIPYGVRDFKTRFGGRTVNYGRFLRINNRIVYHMAIAGFYVLSVFRKILFWNSLNKS